MASQATRENAFIMLYSARHSL